MPWSMTFINTCSTVVMMVLPPGDPVTNTGSPSRRTIVGVIELSMRLPGAMALASSPSSPKELGVFGLTEKSSISLLSRKPAPGTTILAP